MPNEDRHLRVLYGYESHITMHALRQTYYLHLDLVTIGLDTSHILQPLDMSFG